VSAYPGEPRSADAVAIVTGCSRGHGRELACALSERGFAVVVVYLRHQLDAEACVRAILAANGTAVAMRADVADPLDVERVFDETEITFHGADVVAHAATGGASVVLVQAALRLRPGGSVVSVSRIVFLAPYLARQLAAREVTINGHEPGAEPPGPDHDVGELVALLEGWRAGHGMAHGVHRR